LDDKVTIIEIEEVGVLVEKQREYPLFQTISPLV
jgi:hypothetical protein